MSADHMAEIRFASPEPDSDLLDAVKALGDSQSKSVGLLPYAAWDDYAAAGHVLAALRGDQLLGYCAYRVPRDVIRIAHLVVLPTARGSGVARALVAQVTAKHPERRGIGLSCRRDWEATSVWPKLGFVALGERPGRSGARLPLTEWWLDFGHPDLLSWAPGAPNVAVAMDANIFIDLHTSNPNPEECRTREIVESLEDRIELIVTPELFNELNRQSDAAERVRLTQIAQSYPALRAPKEVVDEYEDSLNQGRQGALGTQDRSDRRHVAWAAAAKVQVLLTRDRKIRHQLGEAAQTSAGVSVCTPSTLVAVVHEAEMDGSYSPLALQSTAYSLREIAGSPMEAHCLLDSPGGERRGDYERLLESVSARHPQSHLTLIESPDSGPEAAIGVYVDAKTLVIPVARTGGTAIAQTVATQMTQLVRQWANEFGCSSIMLTDPHASATIREACSSDGFAPFQGGMAAVTITEALPVQTFNASLQRATESLPGKAAAAVQEIASQLALSPAALEHAFRPLRLTDADLPTWLVPIKPTWAADLFGYPEMLFQRTTQLGLSTEHIYYKKQKAGESAPGRVLWYASEPASAVFACSLLVGVRDATPKELFRSFSRLGVYTFEHVKSHVGGDGKVRALNVTDTEIFPSPVPLRRLREIATGLGEPLNLIGAKLVSSDLFAALISEGRSQ